MTIDKLPYPAQQNETVQKINEIIDNFPSGTVVDQVYDPTSANAQSGVAIAGANFLTSSDLTNYVTTNTDQNITGVKTFVGTKKVAFKQSGSSDKLGFTLYNNSGTEKGYLEFNPTNTIDGAPLMTLGNYASTAAGITHVGFRKYSSVSGANGAYNLLAPLIADAKTPFNLTTTYTNFYLPLGFTDGTTTVTTAKSGLVNISSLLPSLSGYATEQWVENKGYITGITSSDVTTALGYTPYNSTNPSGYQANVIETIKVNGTAQTITSKTVDISVPTEATVSGWGFTKNAGTVTSVNNVSPVSGNVTLSIPTITDTYSATSSNGMSGKAVASAISGKADSATTLSGYGITDAYTKTEVDGMVASVYKPAGSIAFASRPTPGKTYEGNVYNITDAFTTDSTFVEGSGKSYPAGTNIVCINTSGTTYKWDVLSGIVDLSGYVPTSRTINGKALTGNITLSASDVSALPSSTTIPTITDTYSSTSSDGMSGKAVASAISSKQDSSTAVTHTASTAVGDANTPVYINSSGAATALSYTIATSVPSGAVFTDTKNTAGSTQLASTKLYLIGASTQGANPQTYSNSSFYITDTGKLNIPNPDASSNSTIAATTKWVMDKGYTTNTGTITGITMNGTSKGTSGVVDLGTVITSHQTIKQDGITGATVNRFGTCSTAAGTVGKEVSITTGTFSLEAGASVRVKFSNANTASSPTLKVGSTDAKNIFHKGSQITTGDNKALLAGVCDFVYDGTQYHLVGNYINTNTDTLMTQNVSSTDSTYPILACPTADATTSQGAKTGIFSADVKLNPSTGTVVTNKVSVGAGVATMQYNSTTEAIEFVFT